MNKQNILTIVFILVLLATGYVWYQYGRSLPPAPPGTEGGAAVSDTLDRVRRLKNLQIDASVFRDPVFRILKPFPRKERPAVVPGRENPFIPF